MILGLGTDIVEIVRIGGMIERHAEKFLNRVYTEDEVKYCNRRNDTYQHFAGRWAAKEAVLKAIGTGLAKGINFKDIEVQSEKSGQPRIQLTGAAKEIATSRGIDEILITMSHCRAYATATAIAVGGF